MCITEEVCDKPEMHKIAVLCGRKMSEGKIWQFFFKFIFFEPRDFDMDFDLNCIFACISNTSVVHMRDQRFSKYTLKHDFPSPGKTPLNKNFA